MNLALLRYDYFLTLPQEVHCIWGRKLSAPTVLFYVNRYGILISRVILMGQLITWQGATGPETQAMFVITSISVCYNDFVDLIHMPDAPDLSTSGKF